MPDATPSIPPSSPPSSTSGTTGLPKGVMLSHNNVASNVLVAEPRVPAVDPNMDYRVLSFLPVCHIFERMLHYLYMYMGAQIHFGEAWKPSRTT